MCLCRRIPSHFISRLIPTLLPPSHSQLGLKPVTRAFITTAAVYPGFPSCANDSDSFLKQRVSVSEEGLQGTSQGQVEPAEQPTVLTPAGPSLSKLQQGLAIALEHKQYRTAGLLLQRLVELYRGDTASRLDVFHRFLGRHDLHMFDPTTLISVLQLLKSSPFEVKNLSPQGLFRLLQTEKCSGELSSAVWQLLNEHCLNYNAPVGLDSIDYQPPEVIRTTISLLRGFAAKSPQEAINTFNILVQTGHIPPEAMPDTELVQLGNLYLILYSSLVKACLHWNWPLLASQFLLDLLKSNKIIHTSIPELASDTLTLILDEHLEANPGANLKACLSLIQKVHDMRPVSDGIIRRYYEAARQFNRGRDAEALYTFTTDPAISTDHRYPPPQGFALGWFMTYLSENSRQTHLCRTLAQRVVVDKIPIPAQVRARFIMITASTGNAALARRLWERYAIGKDKHIVVGDPALLVAMTRLFARLVQQTESKLQQAEDRVANAKNSSALPPSSVETLRNRLPDLRSFLDTLLVRFKQRHEPMEKASHWILTSYARACFVVGKETEGFRHLAEVLKRSEVPDIYDFNVSLSGLAQRNPRAAAKLIDDMKRGGAGTIQPDSASYGTVLGRALAHSDFELVDTMTARIRELGVRKLTLKTVAGLLRASITPRPNDTRELRTSRLEEALDIAQTWIDSNSVTSPQTGRYLVQAALQLDNPTAAYKFWRMMLREGWEWGDSEHESIRRKISNMIQHHLKHGFPTAENPHHMLTHLSVK